MERFICPGLNSEVLQSFAMPSRAMRHPIGPFQIYVHRFLFILNSLVQTMPYTRFAMKKHEVPKTNNPAVTVVGISNFITGLCTRRMSYSTKTILGCQFPAQEPSHSSPTYPSQYSWAIRSCQERSISPRHRQSAPAAHSSGY